MIHIFSTNRSWIRYKPLKLFPYLIDILIFVRSESENFFS